MFPQIQSSSTNLKNENKIFSRLAYGIIALSALLRILLFLQNRSLFIDEASLSSQLVGKTYAQLFGNFKDQFAPPFFSVIVKTATEIFGSTEYALRLFPLIFGILGLVLFYKVCKEFLTPKHIIFPLLLFGFSMNMVQYSTEVKQYSSDVALALAMLLLCLKIRPSSIQNSHFLIWSIIGIFSVWFSMPVVFVLFAVGIYYGLSFLQKGKKQQILFLGFTILSWLASFRIYFFSIIKNDLGLEKLENYHAPFFLPLFPTSLEDWAKIGNILLSFYRTAIGSTAVAIGWGMFSTAVGIYAVFKKEKLLIILLLLPILTVMIASGLQYYSLIPRLTLFFIPTIILLIGWGTQKILAFSPKVLQWVVLAFLAIIIFNQSSFPYFFNRFEIEELRPVLKYVKQHSSPDELKYVHYQAENAYVFYSQFYKEKGDCHLENAVVGVWNDRVDQWFIDRKEEKIWFVFSHFEQQNIDAILSALDGKTQIKDHFKTTGASCYLLEKSSTN